VGKEYTSYGERNLANIEKEWGRVKNSQEWQNFGLMLNVSDTEVIVRQHNLC